MQLQEECIYGWVLNAMSTFFFQDMPSATITPCGHFFHASCLKKWLYVQETCPLCHCQLKNPTQPPESGLEPNPGAEHNTVLQEATETAGVDRQEGGEGGEALDSGQAGNDLRDGSAGPKDALSSESNRGRGGLSEEQEKSGITRFRRLHPELS